MAMDLVTSDAISAMLNGGQRVADEATEKWLDPEYYNLQDQRKERVQHWRAVHSRIYELSRQLKEQARC